MQAASSSSTIYTIGHSTHAIEVFIAMLRSFEIEVLADIRSFPGSKKFPQFNKVALAASLQQAGIAYVHFPALGGKQQPVVPSVTKAKKPFGGYVEYMRTEPFKMAVDDLQKRAFEKRFVYMCAEVLWWQCHRSMVSDYLKAEGWKVLHIMAASKMQEHFRPGNEKEIQGILF